MDHGNGTQDINSIQEIYELMMAYVDAVIPRTPELAQLYGEIMYYGALDFYTDEYVVMNLIYSDQLFPFINSLSLDTQPDDYNSAIMMGYYSEWFGYGSTRLNPPDQRVLEFYPTSWEQVGYPGPSFSYVAYVNQYYQIRNIRNGNT